MSCFAWREDGVPGTSPVFQHLANRARRSGQVRGEVSTECNDAKKRCVPLLMSAMSLGRERGGRVPCFAQGRQAGGLPFLPAVSEVMRSGVLPCLQTPNLRHLPLTAWRTGVGGVSLDPGGWAAPEGEQMLLLVEKDACSLHVLLHPVFAVPSQPDIQHTCSRRCGSSLGFIWKLHSPVASCSFAWM